ncbi:MAG: type II secretion system protein [Hydrogenimonas sp.]|nr:MAG: type II secretion system protein [Hydrogenimonas sp.]
MRPAFTLISAIFLMVLIAILLMLSLSLSSETTKQTGDLYLREQALLLAKSSTELALLAISGNDWSSNCIEQINLQYPQTDPIYDINMTLTYLGNNLPCSTNHLLANNIQTTDSNGTVLIDTFVTYTDNASNETIRIHRRTIQKP